MAVYQAKATWLTGTVSNLWLLSVNITAASFV